MAPPQKKKRFIYPWYLSYLSVKVFTYITDVSSYLDKKHDSFRMFRSNLHGINCKNSESPLKLSRQSLVKTIIFSVFYGKFCNNSTWVKCHPVRYDWTQSCDAFARVLHKDKQMSCTHSYVGETKSVLVIWHLWHMFWIFVCLHSSIGTVQCHHYKFMGFIPGENTVYLLF